MWGRDADDRRDSTRVLAQEARDMARDAVKEIQGHKDECSRRGAEVAQVLREIRENQDRNAQNTSRMVGDLHKKINNIFVGVAATVICGLITTLAFVMWQ